MATLKDRADCKDEALATAQAILTITQSDQYQELLAAFEREDKQTVRKILKDIGVKKRIITKMLDTPPNDLWSPHSVAFTWC